MQVEWRIWKGKSGNVERHFESPWTQQNYRLHPVNLFPSIRD
jgi:hypothetical protein